jgi:hypothetical protein
MIAMLRGLQAFDADAYNEVPDLFKRTRELHRYFLKGVEIERIEATRHGYHVRVLASTLVDDLNAILGWNNGSASAQREPVGLQSLILDPVSFFLLIICEAGIHVLYVQVTNASSCALQLVYELQVSVWDTCRRVDVQVGAVQLFNLVVHSRVRQFTEKGDVHP